MRRGLPLKRELSRCIFSILLSSLVLAAAPTGALADTVTVPLKKVLAPASDLFYKNAPIDKDTAIALRAKGVDLGLLDPSPNDAWRSQGFQQQDEGYPADGATLDFVAIQSSVKGLFRSQVNVPAAKPGARPNPFRLVISLGSHRALLTAELMRSLGYNQPLARRYSRLTLRFPSIGARDTFVTSVRDRNNIASIWIVSQPADKPELVLQDVLLEPARIDIAGYNWGILKTNTALGRRALRALLLPISIANVPESINYYSWDYNRVLSDSLVFDYPEQPKVGDQPAARPFDETTIDDLRWAARRFAKLSAADLARVVDAAQYPKDIAAIVLQKLIARRNQLVAGLEIGKELPASQAQLPYTLKLNNPSVKDGKVVYRDKWDGYASLFAYGDPQDILTTEDLFRFGLMTGLASGMETLASQISDKLVAIGADHWAQKHQEQLFNDFIDRITQNPDVPYEQPIQSWGGPILGASVNASRSVTTGTYYGSDAKLQLVDNVGIAAQVGYFLGIDGVQKVVPAFSGNLSLARNYVHVRPVPGMKEATDATMNNFAIPLFLRKLAKMLDDRLPDETPGQTIDLSAEAARIAAGQKEVQAFLEKLVDGEMFTMTDTLLAGVSGQAILPISALVPTAPVGYNQNIAIGGQVSGVVLKRTTFTRVKSGGQDAIQIYVQTLDTAGAELSLDLNYWLNLLKVSGTRKAGLGRTQAFIIKTDKSMSEENSSKFAASVRTLFRTNSTQSLKENFPAYLLKHELDETAVQGKFLFYRSLQLEEAHRLRIQPPVDPEHRFDPKDFERTLYSYRMLDRTGYNFAGLISDIVSSATKGDGKISSQENDNPAYTPYGRANWSTVTTEAELTAGKSFVPVTISEQYWAGWSISKDRLFRIFDVIDSSIRGLGLNMSPIHRDVFNNTQKVEFYEVRSTLIFYQKGFDRLKAMILAKDIKSPYSPTFFDRVGGGIDEWSPSDRNLFATMVAWMGKGRFDQACAASTGKAPGDGGPTLESYRGNTYSCILPWMKQVLDLRRFYPAGTEGPELREAKVRWQTQILSLFQKNTDLAPLLAQVGRDGFFFQVKVSGFRKGDEDATDKNGTTSDYISDSVGTFDQYAGGGPFRDLAEDTQIMAHELYARYFSEGY